LRKQLRGCRAERRREGTPESCRSRTPSRRSGSTATPRGCSESN